MFKAEADSSQSSQDIAGVAHSDLQHGLAPFYSVVFSWLGDQTGQFEFAPRSPVRQASLVNITAEADSSQRSQDIASVAHSDLQHWLSPFYSVVFFWLGDQARRFEFTPRSLVR